MDIDLTKLKPDVRRLDEMKNVLYDQEWLKNAANVELYYMYRKTKVENELRYDITIIPPRMLGKEFVKTKGHTHQGFYGEIYMVLEGEGIYFAQKGDENKIEDVLAVKAKKGDVIMIPAGYGHVTINPSTNQELKTANWVAENDKGDFSMFEKNQGACYYYIATQSRNDAELRSQVEQSSLRGKEKRGNEKIEGIWVKNERYKSVPELRFEEPLKSVPENMDFLKAN